jgi:RNA polymerase sigma-70 factor (ECF subfamily)
MIILITDNELLELFRKSPEKALAKLIDNYAALVYTIVHGKICAVCSKEDIEECVSDVFYDLYKNTEHIDLQKGSIKALLSVIAKRKAIDAFRRLSKMHHHSVSLDEPGYDTVPDKKADTQGIISAAETKAELIRGVKALGRPDSEIFIRKFYFGQSTKLIAQTLKIKENTIDKKVSRGLTKLKQELGGIV